MNAAQLQVAVGSLRGIAEEMGTALIHSALSPNIKERRDCSTALFNPDGRLVIQAGSCVARPYSPNATVWPHFASPDMRPRMTLRCLTRRGINMVQAPPVAGATASRAGVRSGMTSPR